MEPVTEQDVAAEFDSGRVEGRVEGKGVNGGVECWCRCELKQFEAGRNEPDCVEAVDAVRPCWCWRFADASGQREPCCGFRVEKWQ